MWREGQSALFNGVKAALDEGLSQVKGVPLIAVSAATGKGLDQLLGAAFETRDAWSKRVGTGQLNRWFEMAVEKNPPPAPGGKRIKLRYLTQAKTRPPGFVLFGTRVDQLPVSYQRYLINGIRKESGLRRGAGAAHAARAEEPIRNQEARWRMTETLLDLRGMRCPWPAIRVGRALRDAAEGAVILAVADDPAAPREIGAVASERGWQISRG